MNNPSPREKVVVWTIAMVSYIAVLVAIFVQFAQPATF